MEQIYVESNKSYRHGFILKEQELRRLIDLMNDQFKKITLDAPEYNFEVKYKNGAIANTTDFESILRQENEGSSSIVKLIITGNVRDNADVSIIKLDFKNPDLSEDDSVVPIKHLIKGQSRDWVFVTSSLVEERIAKIKRRIMDPTKKSNGLIYRLIFPVFMLVLMGAMFSGIPEASNDLISEKEKAISTIEKKWKNKEITDPVLAIIQIEKVKTSTDTVTASDVFSIFLSKGFLLIFGSLLIFMLLTFIFFKYYPAYNFYWGNYIEIFDKKESIRKLIIGILLGTIILGIIVNLLSNIIWEKFD